MRFLDTYIPVIYSFLVTHYNNDLGALYLYKYLSHIEKTLNVVNYSYDMDIYASLHL